MTKRRARILGALAGIEAVECWCQEQGEQALLDASLGGWDEPAINAGAAECQGVPRELREVYYVAYARNARRRHRQLACEIRAKADRGEELDRGIFGVLRAV